MLINYYNTSFEAVIILYIYIIIRCFNGKDNKKKYTCIVFPKKFIFIIKKNRTISRIVVVQ